MAARSCVKVLREILPIERVAQARRGTGFYLDEARGEEALKEPFIVAAAALRELGDHGAWALALEQRPEMPPEVVSEGALVLAGFLPKTGSMSRGDASMSRVFERMPQGDEPMLQDFETMSRSDALMLRGFEVMSRDDAAISRDDETMSRREVSMHRELEPVPRRNEPASRGDAAMSRDFEPMSRGDASMLREFEVVSRDDAAMLR